jgi:hypothetical protein
MYDSLHKNVLKSAVTKRFPDGFQMVPKWLPDGFQKPLFFSLEERLSRRLRDSVFFLFFF